MKKFFSAIFNWIDIENPFSLWKYFKKMIIFMLALYGGIYFVSVLRFAFAMIAVGWWAGCKWGYCAFFEVMAWIFIFLPYLLIIIGVYNFIRYFIFSFKNSEKICQKIFIIIFSAIPVFAMYLILSPMILGFFRMF